MVSATPVEVFLATGVAAHVAALGFSGIGRLGHQLRYRRGETCELCLGLGQVSHDCLLPVDDVAGNAEFIEFALDALRVLAGASFHGQRETPRQPPPVGLASYRRWLVVGRPKYLAFCSAAV